MALKNLSIFLLGQLNTLAIIHTQLNVELCHQRRSQRFPFDKSIWSLSKNCRGKRTTKQLVLTLLKSILLCVIFQGQFRQSSLDAACSVVQFTTRTSRVCYGLGMHSNFLLN